MYCALVLTAAPQQGCARRVASWPAYRLRLGDADGEVRFHPDEAVMTAVRNIFAQFAETGSARRVWLWSRACVASHLMRFLSHTFWSN
jgi:hypothetical protein